MDTPPKIDLSTLSDEELDRQIAEAEAGLSTPPESEAPATAEPELQDAGVPIDELEKGLTDLEKARMLSDPEVFQSTFDRHRANSARLKADGGMKFTGDDAADYDFFRWANKQGHFDTEVTAYDVASGLARGLWGFVKGGAKGAVLAARATTSPDAAKELAATAVDSAQGAVSENQMLGAGLAVLTSGDNPEVKLAAKYELMKFADAEQKDHAAWRRAINKSFAEVAVDKDIVEFGTEALDVSSLIGAGAGKLVTKGLRGVGASAVADTLGASRKLLGSDALAKAASKVPVFGAPYKRAILVGQADVLSVEVTDAYHIVAEAQSKLAAKRATLAADGPSDTLLSEIAKSEADVASALADYSATKGQLDAMRGQVTEALDLEGRGLLNRVAAPTLQKTGALVEGTGNLLRRAWRGGAEFFSGDPDSAAIEAVAGAAGVAGIVSRGNVISRAGRDLQTLGKTMEANDATIPYFRRVAQSKGVGGLTKSIANALDHTHVAWAADKVSDFGRSAAAGAPVSGAFGYVASGGDVEAAAESAGFGAGYGIGGGAYGQWQAYKDPGFRYDELLANRRQFRDTLSKREIGGASQLQIFDQLDAGDQIALASYAQGKPDAAFRFINDPAKASGHYDRVNNIIVINKASKTPIHEIFVHELGHFVERHGLEGQVRQLFLGDAEKGVLGEYTALDKDGNPTVEETVDADGQTVRKYKLNEAGEALRTRYQEAIRQTDPTFTMSDEYLASEIFAEQYAERALSGNMRRDLRGGPVSSVFEALASKKVMKEFLGGIGLLFDQKDNVVGTGVFKDLIRNREVEKLIGNFNREVKAARAPEMDAEVEPHVFTETELRDPAVATKWLQAGGGVRFGPDGKPVYDKNGTPQFLTEKEADAMQRDLANELIVAIERYNIENPGDKDLIQRRENVDVNGKKSVTYSGTRLPMQIIDALEAQKRHNPHQLATLRALSATVEKHGPGAMFAHFYQAAMRKLGGKAYKTLAGRWRRDGAYGFKVTKDGNVLVDSVSWEQLGENARRAAKTKEAKALYADAGVPIEAAITADLKTYLDNAVTGKPGSTGLGIPKRDFLNNMFGIRMKSNEDANPYFALTNAPKIVITSLRLDRINRAAPLDTVEYPWGTEQYRRVKLNQRPETPATEDRRSRGDSVQFRPDPNAETAKVAARYVEAELGRPIVPHTEYEPIPEGDLRAIADYFETDAKHAPDDPEVAKSYAALTAETKAQYDAMVAAGVVIEPWTSKGEPYKSSTDMATDVRDNKHLWFFLTDNGFGSGATDSSHPMLAKSGVKLGGRELLNNDLFRAVHDYFGHTPQGLEFGPRGEFNAWKSHSTMFSDAAQGALAAETLAQNAWVNFGPHLRDSAGKIAKKGEPGFVAPQDRPFADQRAFVLPAALREQLRPGSTGDLGAEAYESLVDSGPKTGVQSRPENLDTRDSGGALKHTVKPKTLKVAHYSNVEGIEVVDPKYMGQAHKGGTTNHRLLRGAMKSFFFVGNSKPKVGENVSSSRRQVYKTEIDSSRIYNMDTDPLNLWGAVNPAKSEGALKDAGYDGFFAETQDGRQFVALFYPVDLKTGAFVRPENKVEADTKTKPAKKTQADRDYEAWEKQKAKVWGGVQMRPEVDRGVSSAPLFEGTEKLDLGGKTKAAEIGKALAARARAIKRIPYDSRTAGAKAAIAASLADEIITALSKHNNARGWYEAKVTAAMQQFARAHPEIADDPARGSLFRALLAITSNGQKVLPNAERADYLYQGWKDTGRFETDSSWGSARSPQINGALKLLQRLLDERGLEATVEFLNRKTTVRDLKKAGFSVTGDSPDHTVWGSAIFGPKVGAGFYPNLHGDFSPVTMDLWLMRTWNRTNGSFGVPDPVGMGRALSNIRSFVAKNPDHPAAREINSLTDRQLGNWAEARFAVWQKGGFKNTNPLDRAAKAFAQYKEGAMETPRGPKERAWIREVFGEVDKVLAARGQPPITNADKQALLWYYEKDLYTLFGYRIKRESVEQDYATAAESVVNARLAGRAAAPAP